MEHRSQVLQATMATGVVCLVALAWLRGGAQTTEFAPQVAERTCVLLLLPLLAVLLWTRDHPASFGLAPGNRFSRRYGGGAFLLACVTLPLLIPLGTLPAAPALPFYLQLGLSRPIDWGDFAYFHLLNGLLIFSSEWFFRGFLLSGLWRGFGAMALLLQAAAYLIAQIGSTPFDLVTALPAALVLGFVTWRCGSFVPGFLARWAATVYLDLLLVLLRHRL